MRIALGQIDMGFENKEMAMELCSQLMAEAKEKAVDFVVFPEMTLTGFSLNPETYGEDRQNSPSISFFKEEAKKNGVAVCFGLPVYENGV
ncbi:MAG: carbon-nitrogen family hydrolase, partial [Anaerotignum sp.]|nr:carbon-nitrogen family hydrolase [Anaerotignum sp.]